MENIPNITFRFLEGMVYFCKESKLFFQVLHVKLKSEVREKYIENTDLQELEPEEEVLESTFSVDYMIISFPSATYKGCLVLTRIEINDDMFSENRIASQCAINKLRKLNNSNLIKLVGTNTLTKLNINCVLITQSMFLNWTNAQSKGPFLNGLIDRFLILKDIYSIEKINLHSFRSSFFNEYKLNDTALVHLNVPTLRSNPIILINIKRYGTLLEDILEEEN